MDDTLPSVPSLGDIDAIQLPTAAADIVSEYERRIGHRPSFLWKWLYEVFPRYRLSSVPDRYHSAVREQKLLLTIFYTLLDDIADVHGDWETYMAARLLPFSGVEPDYDRATVDADYLALAEQAWDTAQRRIREAPRAEEFWPVFVFDVQQPLTAMHYSCLVAEVPSLVTETGIDVYDQHNMAQFSYADVDLMHSPDFDAGDLSELREVIWTAQRLARISNWVATWERELDEGDPTSAIVVRALREGIITLDDIADEDVPTDRLAERVRTHGIEQALLDEWDHHYETLRAADHDVATVDVADYVAGMKEMRDLYLAYSDRL